jgi:hypothetical protein
MPKKFQVSLPDASQRERILSLVREFQSLVSAASAERASC